MQRVPDLRRSMRSLVGTGVLTLLACDLDDDALTMRDHQIPAAPGDLARASLGMGYNEISEQFRGDCAEGEVIELGGGGGEEAIVYFDQSMSKEQVASALGFELKARARYGVAKFSGAAAFAASTQENSYSSTTVYSAHYRFNNLKLHQPRVRDMFEGLSDDKFVESCGHEYVEQITRGAKIFIAVKVDLHDETAKQEFEASFSMKGPAAKVSATLTEAKSRFAGRATITVQAYQVGGQVSRLSAVLSGTAATKHQNPDESSLRAVLSCGFDDVESCQKMLETALYYATDVEDAQAFPQQIDESPVDTGYVTKPWATAGHHLPPVVISQGLRAARDQLSSMFEEELTVLQRVRDMRKMGGRLSEEQRARLPELEQRALKNIGLITDAVSACYDTTDDCFAAVEQVSAEREITPFEELRFILGPLTSGLYMHEGTLLRGFNDASYCHYENEEHFKLSWPGKSVEDRIQLYDWDNFMETTSARGLCRLDLEPGLYSSYSTVFQGQGDQLCNYISPTHFNWGAAPLTWDDVVEIPRFAGFFHMFTLTGHCRVILPKGFWYYQPHERYYRSDGVDSYCLLAEPPYKKELKLFHIEYIPLWTDITEAVPFESFMIFTGDC
jgi:hypothetical protein